MDIQFLYKWIGVLLSFQIFHATLTAEAKYSFNLRIKFDGGRVKTTWDTVPDATVYYVYQFVRNKWNRTETTNTFIEISSSAHSYQRMFEVRAKLVNGSWTHSKRVYYYKPKIIFSRVGSSVSFDIEFKLTDIDLIKNNDNGKTLFNIGNSRVSPVNLRYIANITSASREKTKLSVTIQNVTPEDAGYIVGYQNNEERSITGVLLVVLDMQTPVINGPQEVQVGQTVNLNCSLQFSHRPDYFVLKNRIRYTWFGNNEDLNKGRKGVLQIYKLTDSRLNKTYTCKGQFKDISSRMSDPFSFQITSSPASITGIYINRDKVQNSTRVSIHKGQSASVTCSTDGYPHPDIILKRNSKNILETRRTVNTAQFSITNPTCGDWNYSCEVNNSVGKDRAFFTLAVLCPPTVPYFKRNYEVVGIENKTLSFKVQSNPKPTAKITLNDREVLIFNVTIDPKSSFMYEMSLTMEVQFGNYLLILSNKEGGKAYDFQVSLPAKRVLSRTGSKVDFDIEYNIQDVNFIKNKDTNKLLFQFVNKDIQSRDTDRFSAIISSIDEYTGKVKLSMTINDVQMEDAGYIIGYRNEGERLDTGVLLIVLEMSKPVVIGRSEVQIGETVKLTCSMRFSYQPEYFVLESGFIYKWFRNKSKLQPRRENELTINNISYRDNTYSCQVQLEIRSESFLTSSTQSDPFIFQITSPATITSIRINDTNEVQKGQNVSVPMGQPSSVTCSAAGNPPPEIIWKRNGDKLPSIMTTPNTSQFSTTNAMCGDFSNYSCEASNKARQDSKYFTLAVLCRPEIRNFNGNYEVIGSENKTLSFKVRANPKPTVTVTPPNNEKAIYYDVEMDLLNSDMYYMSITMEVQYGNYTLTLSNVMGSNAYLIQVSLPERTTEYSSAEISGHFNTPLVITLAVSGGILIIVATTAILILKKKISKRSDKHTVPKERQEGIVEPLEPAAEDMICQGDNELSPAVSVQGTSSDLYASVNKPSWTNAKTNRVGDDQAPVISDQTSLNDLYASVNKPSSTKTKTKQGNKPKVPKMDEASTSKNNKIEIPQVQDTSGRKTNQDGLIYIDVEFKKPPKEDSGSLFIHGNEDRTIYTTISHTQGGATAFSDDD